MITFAAPLVLLAALAVAVPIVLHLLGRATAPTFEFPALRFVLAAAVKTARRRRIENAALLALRVALFALLPLALALPFFRSKSLGFAAGGDLALAIVLDDTASMHQRVGNQSAFERAQLHALRLLRGSDTLAAPRHVVFLTPIRQPAVSTTNTEPLPALIRSLAPTAAEADLTTTIQRATELLTPLPSPNKLIFVLTDLQKSGLHPDRLADTKVPIAVLNFARPGDNFGIRDVTFTKPLIAGKSITAAVTITGRAGLPRNLTLKLTAGNGTVLATQDVLFTGRPLEPVPLTVKPLPAGPLTGTIQLTPDDALPVDNRWCFSVNVNPAVPAVIVTDPDPNRPWSADPAFFVAAALKAPGWIRTQTIPPGSLKNAHNANVLILLNPDHADEPALTAFLKTGRKAAVLFADTPTPLLEKIGLGKIAAPLQPDPPAIVRETDAADPLIAALGLKPSLYRQIAVTRGAKFTPASGAEPLLLLSTGDPLLVRRTIGDSNLYLFTAQPLMDRTTLPLSPPFPALLAQIAADTVRGDTELTFRAGAPLIIQSGKPAELLAPTSQPAAALQPGTNRLTLFDPGLYTMKFPAGQTLVVNPSEKAGDLTTLPLDAFANRPNLFAANSPETLETQLSRLARGTPLWNTLLAVILLVLIAETLLANFRKSADTIPSHL